MSRFAEVVACEGNRSGYGRSVAHLVMPAGSVLAASDAEFLAAAARWVLAAWDASLVG